MGCYGPLSPGQCFTVLNHPGIRLAVLLNDRGSVWEVLLCCVFLGVYSVTLAFCLHLAVFPLPPCNIKMQRCTIVWETWSEVTGSSGSAVGTLRSLAPVVT